MTVATPNSTHFEITKSFLEAGFNVLCEKPMTMTIDKIIPAETHIKRRGTYVMDHTPLG